jgi:hypothetical protein
MPENMTASREWATRPNDERFLTLGELKESVAQRRSESWTLTTPVKDLRVKAIDGEHLGIEAFDRTAGEPKLLTPTHFAFTQLAGFAKAPASYLRTLPDQLTAINLEYGLAHQPMREESLILAQTNGDDTLRAMTSVKYGRIWDMEVVEAVERVNEDDRWKVPSASYSGVNPRRATTLYASDRDVFIFLVDPERPIEVGGETLFRGFFTWNSEVGSATFGLTTFLYRYICDNRIIWGATDVQELRIRHTGGAPERFAYEGAKYLERYAEESTFAIAEGIRKAQAWELDRDDRKGDGWEGWLQQRGFTKPQATNAVNAAVAEEGEARSLWDIINGITASARSIQHTDARVELETAAGKLMRFAS